MKKVIRLTESELRSLIKKVISEQPVADPTEYGLRIQKPQAASEVGQNVVEIQQYLLSLGYDLGPTGADGYLGSKTSEAIKQFQQSLGQAPTGKLSLDQYKQLQNKSRTEGTSDTNTPDVKLLQQRLNDWGAKPPLKTDGIRGPLTKKAIIDFQKSEKLPLTGTFDKATVAKLTSIGGGKVTSIPGDVVPKVKYDSKMPSSTTTTTPKLKTPKTGTTPPPLNQFM